MQGIQYNTSEKPKLAGLCTGRFFIVRGVLKSVIFALCQVYRRVNESGRTKGRSCIMYGKERKRVMLESKEDITRKPKRKWQDNYETNVMLCLCKLRRYNDLRTSGEVNIPFHTSVALLQWKSFRYQWETLKCT